MFTGANKNKAYVSKIFSCIFVLIIAFQAFNKANWQHAHILSDGTVISHAHPYNKTNDQAPVKNHHHNQSEYCFALNIEILFLCFFSSLILVLLAKETFHYRFLSSNVHSFYHHKLRGRAPPLHMA